MTTFLTDATSYMTRTLVYESVKSTVLFGAQKIALLVDSYIDLNKVIIITAVALSCLAVVVSIVQGSMLAVSLAGALVAASCLCYKMSLELQDKALENKQLQGFIICEKRQKQEHLEEHGRIKEEHVRVQSLNRELEARLAKALELVEFCESFVDKVGAATLEQKAGVKEIKEVSAELQSYKGVLSLWTEEMRRMLKKDEEAAEASQRVVRILEDFSRGQHHELARMLQQLQAVQKQIEASSEIVKEQQETLRGISKDIMTRTQELQKIHATLSDMYQAKAHTVLAINSPAHEEV